MSKKRRKKRVLNYLTAGQQQQLKKKAEKEVAEKEEEEQLKIALKKGLPIVWRTVNAYNKHDEVQPIAYSDYAYKTNVSVSAEGKHTVAVRPATIQEIKKASIYYDVVNGVIVGGLKLKEDCINPQGFTKFNSYNPNGKLEASAMRENEEFFKDIVEVFYPSDKFTIEFSELFSEIQVRKIGDKFIHAGCSFYSTSVYESSSYLGFRKD